MLCASEIIEKYLQGASLASLGREYNCNSLKIRKLLCDNGIQIRSQKDGNLVIPSNHDTKIPPFSTLVNPQLKPNFADGNCLLCIKNFQ